jgi:hypothetical protein
MENKVRIICYERTNISNGCAEETGQYSKVQEEEKMLGEY